MLWRYVANADFRSGILFVNKSPKETAGDASSVSLDRRRERVLRGHPLRDPRRRRLQPRARARALLQEHLLQPAGARPGRGRPHQQVPPPPQVPERVRAPRAAVGHRRPRVSTAESRLRRARGAHAGVQEVPGIHEAVSAAGRAYLVGH